MSQIMKKINILHFFSILKLENIALYQFKKSMNLNI